MFTFKFFPDLMKFFSRILSNAGSSSSPMSSSSNGRPRDKESSKWFRKYLWFNDVTHKSLFDSLFLIQPLPWPWKKVKINELNFSHNVPITKIKKDLIKAGTAIILSWNLHFHKNYEVQTCNMDIWLDTKVDIMPSNKAYW